MPASDNRQLGRRFFEETLGKGKWDAAPEFVSEQVVMHHPSSPEPVRGLPAVQGFLSQFRNGFSDFNMNVEDVVEGGDKVTVRWRARGTHDNTLFGIPPTGKQMNVAGISVLRIANGKIAEDWVSEDSLGLMQQLGVIKLS